MKGGKMGLLGDLSGGYSAGGSSNYSQSTGWSSTDAASARAWSEQQATVAYERQRQLMQEQMAYNSAEAALARQFNAEEALKARNFNAEEATKSRDWQAEMANTVYTRSVKNLKEAGINPILAYNMGLSGANVGSGATASGMGASGSGGTASLGSAPLAQNFMDSASASQSSGRGSSWNESESGLAAGLQAMGELISGVIGNLNSSHTIDLILDQGGKAIKDAGNTLIREISGGKYDGIDDARRGIRSDFYGHKDYKGLHTSPSGRYHGGGSYTF